MALKVSFPGKLECFLPPFTGGVPAEGGVGGKHRMCPLRFARKCSLGTSPVNGGGKNGTTHFAQAAWIFSSRRGQAVQRIGVLGVGAALGNAAER